MAISQVHVTSIPASAVGEQPSQVPRPNIPWEWIRIWAEEFPSEQQVLIVTEQRQLRSHHCLRVAIILVPLNCLVTYCLLSCVLAILHQGGQLASDWYDLYKYYSRTLSFCSVLRVMFRPQGNDFNRYLVNNPLLPFVLNDGLSTQPAQTTYQTPHVIGSCTCGVLHICDQGNATKNTFHSASPALPAVNPSVTYTCPLGTGCTFPLEATTKSLYAHLPLHGHNYKHRDRAPCPWPGCSKVSRWGNVGRHIIERHLGVKMECEYCGKTYKRRGDLKAHMKGCVEHLSARSAGSAYMPHTM